ncbi:MAG: hypothetical protein JXM68_02520 [Sedimentisphaerales bacterium]|nr:hypothetical protein [Sedimentisphaerales bacterium]
MTRKHTLLFLATVVALAALAYFFTTYDISELDETIKNKSMELALLKEDIERTEPYVAMWDSIKDFMEEDPGERLTAYGNFIISLETERNFFFQSTPEERAIAGNEQMREIAFRLEFNSTIKDLAEFLGRLDAEQKKLLKIESMTVNYTGKNLAGTLPDNTKDENKDLAVTLVLAAPVKKIDKIAQENELFPGNLLK